MKHLTIVIPNGENNLSSVVGTYKVFKRANAYSKSVGKKEVFSKIQLAGLSKEVTYHEGLFSVKPHCMISAIKKTDFIIIPAISKDFAASIDMNQPLIQWVSDQYRKGSEVASICTGA